MRKYKCNKKAKNGGNTLAYYLTLFLIKRYTLTIYFLQKYSKSLLEDTIWFLPSVFIRIVHVCNSISA